MRACTWLFASTFTNAYLQFQKSQKANFSYMCSTLVCLIYLMQKSCYFLCENIILVNFEQKEKVRLAINNSCLLYYNLIKF